MRTAEQAGFDKVITFDMGGTSTDVAHYENSYERVFETVVAGVRMQAPMLLIHTVAAGGGSLCQLTGRVSGRSGKRRGQPRAGLLPAWRTAGGDRLQCHAWQAAAGILPPVFGPNQDEPLDAEAVRARFTEMAAEVESSTGIARSPEELADGFLRIAVENMANAIKKISVQRGYDVTDYALQCFGGAGGQHACLIADVLGMNTVLVHPFAGCCRPMAWGLPMCARFASAPLRRRCQMIWSRGWCASLTSLR